MATPCIFHFNKSCRKGDSCRYSHELSNHLGKPTTLRGHATEFVSQQVQAVQPSVKEESLESQRKRSLCLFFVQNRCKYGTTCSYSHVVPVTEDERGEVPPQAVRGGEAIHERNIRKDFETLKIGNEIRPVGGAQVSFHDGVEVASVNFSSTATGQTNRFQMSTVNCSWYKPSKVGWLHYHSNIWAGYAADRFSKQRNVRGREVQSKVVNPPGHYTRNPIWSVELGNLNVHTTEKDLEQLLKGILPKKILFGKATYGMSQGEACKIVESELAKYGGLVSFESSHSLNPARMKALARFANPLDAKAAVSSLSGTSIKVFGGAKLFVNLIASVKIAVLKEHFEVVQGDIQDLEAQISKVKITSYPPEREGKPVLVRIWGSEVDAVAKAKIALEHILTGKIVLDDESRPVWDPFLGTHAGLTYLREMNQSQKLFIYRDVQRRQLTLHGRSHLFGQAGQSILAKLKERSELTQHLPLTADLLRRALLGGFQRIASCFGKQLATFDRLTNPPMISIQGTVEDLDRARALLFMQSTAEGVKVVAEECPACLTEPEDRTQLHCGHAYCRACIAGLCGAADGAVFPLNCFGDEGSCRIVMPLKEIKASLSSQDFEELLSRSFDAYVRMHPGELQYCPTPECTGIFQVSLDGTIATCGRCFGLICTSCKIISHDGLTCEENRKLGQEDPDLARWKKETGAQDCPKCKALIEKRDGCNHMTCLSCQTHFCWICLKICDEKTIYAHMHREHGSFGL